MSKNIFFGLNSFSKNQVCGNELKPIQMGTLRGMGSTTRKYNWCRSHTSNPELCINEFVQIQCPPENDNNNDVVVEDTIYVSGIYGADGIAQNARRTNLDIYSSNGNKSATLTTPIVSTIVTLSSNYLVYLMKYDKNGLYKWAVKIGNNAYASSIAPRNGMRNQSLKVDKKNKYLYLIGLGYFSNSQIGNPDTRTIYFYSANDSIYNLIYDVGNTNLSNNNFCYFSKYDINGNFMWATYVINPDSLSDSFYFIRNSKLTLDKNQNPIYSFSFSGRLQIYETENANPIATISSNIISSRVYSFDNIILKYDTNGKYLWYTKIGNTFSSGNADPIITSNNYLLSNISCDSNDNVIVTGFWGLNDIDPLKIYNANDLNTPVLTLTKSGTSDVYVVKYNNSGIMQWATKIGGTGSERMSNISIDSFNNIYVFFTYDSTTLNIYDAGDYVTPSLTLTKAIANAGYCLVKYNSNGIAQWASNIYGDNGAVITNTILIPSISINSNDEIIVSSLIFATTLSIYNPQSTTPNKQLTFKNTSTNNSFIVKFNSSGNCIWGTYLGFSTFDNIVSKVGVYSNSLSIDSNNNIIVTGFNDSENLYAYNSTDYNNPALILPFQKLSPSSIRSRNNTFIIKYNDLGVPIWGAQNTANSFNSAVSSG